MSPSPQREGYGQNTIAMPTASASVRRANTPNDEVVRGSGAAGLGAAARAPRAGAFACFSGAAGINASSGSDASCLSIFASSFSQSRSGISSRSPW